MSRLCDLTLKGPLFGHNVSNANNKTKRTFYPNVRWVKVYSYALAQFVSLKLSSAAMRTLDKHGGIDNYIKQAHLSKVPPSLLKLKKKLSETA